jgi:tripartite-type tricarboxylate transporter receptor subunit TctC
VLVPAGTSATIVNKLNVAINEILKAKETVAALAKLSATPRTGAPADLAALMAAETKTWTELINVAGIKAE